MLEGWYFGERDTKVKTSSLSSADEPCFDQRGSLMEKASDVQLSSNANAMRAANAKEDAAESLNSMETNMRYGLFCLLFMYFRALHLVRREMATWGGSNDLITLAPKPTSISEGRQKMIQEEKNVEFRRARMDYVMEKARVGEERKRARIERERLEKVSIFCCSCFVLVSS